MRFTRRIPRDRTPARSRSNVGRTNRLMVETLERRGMLSATIGSLADQAVADVTPAEEFIPSVESFSSEGGGSVGLPEGVSLIMCPIANWADGDRNLIATNSFDDGVAVASLTDPSSNVPGGEELLMCTGYPAPRFTLSGPSDSVDGFEPETTGLSPDVWERGIDELTVITDPVVLDPVAFEPVDIRVAFTYSDSEWASYYYSIGADGSVANVWVVASYGEPTVAAFIADHGSDPGVEVMNCGTCVGVSGLPLELAPPVPEKAEFLGWSNSDSFIDATVSDAPAMDEGDQFSTDHQYDAWAFSTFSVDESAEESGGVESSMRFNSFDGQAVQRGVTPQGADLGAPRFVTEASDSRPTGELAAAAMWMNLSISDTGGTQLPSSKRRSR